MDIFTHVMMGSVATSPFWATHPLESVAFVLGSVLPDVDALSRQFGKVAYLRAHQTWTHAIPVQVLGTVLATLALAWSGLNVFIPSVIALGAGTVCHTLLDWTNTYGVTLFAPFDRSRRSLEWVFFIDAVVIALTTAALAFQAWSFATEEATSMTVALAWLGGNAVYFAMRGLLRTRAARLVPEAVSLVPSALFPSRFWGLSLTRDNATTFSVDAVTGAISDRETMPVFQVDDLSNLAEYRAMHDLSDGFVVTRKDGGRVECRDLRTRNFRTNFGRLVVDISSANPIVEQFDV